MHDTAERTCYTVRPVPRHSLQAALTPAGRPPNLPSPLQEGQGASLTIRMTPVLSQLGQNRRFPVPLQAKQVFQRAVGAEKARPSLLPVPPHLPHFIPLQIGQGIVFTRAASCPELS